MQFYLTASVITLVHGKVRFCLKASGSCNQSEDNRINYKFNQDLHNSLLIHVHDFTWITEVENRNAHEVLEQTILRLAILTCLKTFVPKLNEPFLTKNKPFHFLKASDSHRFDCSLR